MSVLVYDVFDDALYTGTLFTGIKETGVKETCSKTVACIGNAQVSMPVVSEDCLRQWWQRRFVDGVDTVSLMKEAQRWVDQLAIAAVAMLEVDPEKLHALLPSHELNWLLDLHKCLRDLQQTVTP